VVAPDRLRFDFTHNHALSDDQLAEVEKLVNQCVLADERVTATIMPIAQAKKIPGVRAMFGEKYPDPVRVICVGPEDGPGDADNLRSVEFCGGTHLERTSQVGLFKIISEESVAKGVRRITALTGRAAAEYVQQIDSIVKAASLALRVRPAELPQRIEALQREVKELRKAPGKSATAARQFQPDQTIQTDAGEVIVGQVADADAREMRNFCDQLRQKGAAAAMIGSTSQDKVTLIAMVTDELAKSGKLTAGDWVKEAAKAVGGTGGGKATMAQAGGKNPDKLSEALSSAIEYARKKLT